MKRTTWLLVIGCLICAFLLSEVLAGSVKWKRVKSSAKGTLRAVYFGDDKNVFVVGDSGTILASRDAGKKWKKQNSPSKGTLRGVHFTDAKHGWACGDGDPDAPRATGHVVITPGSGETPKSSTCLITSDGGKKWNRVWLKTSFELRSIWMASKKVGQICNHGGEDHADGDKIVTNDGGRNWTSKRVFRGLNDCCWVNEKEGWGVGSRVSVGFMGGRGRPNPLLQNKTARIIHTRDGGQNWEPVDAPDIGGYNQLRSVWFVDKKFGCAVGDAGSILVTTDGGRKWTLCKKVTDKALYAVCFVDKKKGWAVGQNGIILKTTNGGKSWKKDSSPTKKTLYGLHFSKKGSVGIAVGEGGTILRLGSGAQSSSRNKTRRSRQKKLSSAQLSTILRVVGDTVKGGSLSNSAEKKLDSYDGLSKKDFEKVAEKTAAWKTYKACKQEDFTIQAADMQTFVHLPTNYSPKKSYPLVIALPGAGGTGQRMRDGWANTKTDWGAKLRAGYIVVSPAASTWWQWPEGKNVFTLLEEVKSTYNVDPDRVFLTGFSNGGHSTWNLGMKQSSLFAALAPMAGGPVNEAGRGLDLQMIASLINLPVHWVHTSDDRICPPQIARQVKSRYQRLGYDNLTDKEFASGGHSAHTEYWGTLFEWFGKQKRNMYPKKVVFTTDHPELDTAYWVRLGGISPRASVTGEIDGSTIKLTVSNAAKVTLFLSDKMLDLDKPFKVVVNGEEKFSGTVKRSARVAVEEALRRNDRGAIFAAALELDVP